MKKRYKTLPLPVIAALYLIFNTINIFAQCGLPGTPPCPATKISPSTKKIMPKSIANPTAGSKQKIKNTPRKNKVPASLKELGMVRNEGYSVTYFNNGQNILFVMEIVDDFTNDFDGEFPNRDFADIYVDVNKNGKIDELVDRSFGRWSSAIGQICAQYFWGEGSFTGCDGFKSKAKVKYLFVGTDLENTPHPVFRYDIPKSELSADAISACVKFQFFAAGRGYNLVPFLANSNNLPDYKNLFTDVEEIPLNY